jgi:hypothetical protein
MATRVRLLVSNLTESDEGRARFEFEATSRYQKEMFFAKHEVY